MPVRPGFSKGEYRDAAGKTYRLPFARMYQPAVAGNLAIVRTISFSNKLNESYVPIAASELFCFL